MNAETRDAVCTRFHRANLIWTWRSCEYTAKVVAVFSASRHYSAETFTRDFYCISLDNSASTSALPWHKQNVTPPSNKKKWFKHMCIKALCTTQEKPWIQNWHNQNYFDDIELGQFQYHKQLTRPGNKCAAFLALFFAVIHNILLLFIFLEPAGEPAQAKSQRDPLLHLILRSQRRKKYADTFA